MQMEKKAGVAVHISDKIDFNTKVIVRDKEGHYTMIKGTIQHEDITLLSIYAPNIGVPKYVKQILLDLKGEISRNTVIVGDFNTTLTSIDRSFRQKSNKESVALNDRLDQMDLIDIFRAFHFQTVEYTYFSSAHETFSKIDHRTQNKSQQI